MYTRREFGKLTLAGLALHSFRDRPDSRVSGVRLGVQTYSFRDLPRTSGGELTESIISAMKECEFVECELYAQHVEPQLSGEALRQWRLQTPLDHFHAIKDKFDAAGLSIYAYNYSPNGKFSDGEIERGFEITKALGAEIMTSSTNLETAKRIAPMAEKHRMIVAMHGHSKTSDPNEFSTPDSFAAAMKMSRYFKVNLDIGHFTAANFDALAYIREHHADITNLHLKDRKKNQGDNVPWGEGDTPIREVLQLLKKEGWPIRAYIEYEHKGPGTVVEEVKKCFAYAKQALA